MYDASRVMFHAIFLVSPSFCPSSETEGAEYLTEMKGKESHEIQTNRQQMQTGDGNSPHDDQVVGSRVG